MKVKSDFWKKGRELWIQVIAFAIAICVYCVCCYPLYTSLKGKIIRDLYEDLHDMDLEELNEDDLEILS